MQRGGISVRDCADLMRFDLVFRLVEITQHGPEHVAVKLGIKMNTVASRLSKAKAWMTRCVAEADP